MGTRAGEAATPRARSFGTAHWRMNRRVRSAVPDRIRESRISWSDRFPGAEKFAIKYILRPSDSMRAVRLLSLVLSSIEQESRRSASNAGRARDAETLGRAGTGILSSEENGSRLSHPYFSREKVMTQFFCHVYLASGSITSLAR